MLFTFVVFVWFLPSCMYPDTMYKVHSGLQALMRRNWGFATVLHPMPLAEVFTFAMLDEMIDDDPSNQP